MSSKSKKSEAPPATTADGLKPGAGEVLRLVQHDLPDADWPRLASGLADLHQYVRERGRLIIIERERHKELLDALKAEQDSALAKMDPLAEKVKSRKYQAYVLCTVVKRDDDKGVQLLRRTDTGEEFEEPIPGDGPQGVLVDEPPAPPASGVKLCRCPWHPGQANRGETWQCPEHGHMWRRPEDTPGGDPIVELYPGATRPAEGA